MCAASSVIIIGIYVIFEAAASVKLVGASSIGWLQTKKNACNWQASQSVKYWIC